MTDSCDKMEEQTEIIITSETEGKRLDAVLAEKTDGLSRSFLQKLFEEGKVFRNGKLCSKKEKGVEGDCILVQMKSMNFWMKSRLIWNGFWTNCVRRRKKTAVW